MQNFINELSAVIQGDVDIGGFACLYLLYFSIEHGITCKTQSSVGSRSSSQRPVYISLYRLRSCLLTDSKMVTMAS